MLRGLQNFSFGRFFCLGPCFSHYALLFHSSAALDTRFITEVLATLSCTHGAWDGGNLALNYECFLPLLYSSPRFLSSSRLGWLCWGCFSLYLFSTVPREAVPFVNVGVICVVPGCLLLGKADLGE